MSVLDKMTNPAMAAQASLEKREAGMIQQGMPDPQTIADLKGLYYDPFQILDQLGFRERQTGLSYAILEQMTRMMPIWGAIIQLRVADLSNFSVPQENDMEAGFKIAMRDRKKKAGRKDLIIIGALQQMIENCGVTYGMTKDNFEAYLKKTTRDSLTFDQECHPGGTLVEGESGGQKKIEDVVSGELVRTHAGRLRPVLSPMQRKYTGQLVTIRSGGQTVQATAAHPFLAVTDRWFRLSQSRSKGIKPSWVKAEELTCDNYLVYPKPQLEETAVELDIFTSDARYYPTVPYAVIADDVGVHVGTVRAILCGYYKKSGPVVEEVLRVASAYGFERKKRPHPSRVIVDEGFARLCGLYVAEGCVQRVRDLHNGIRFSLSEDEDDLVEIIGEELERLGIDAKIYPDPERHAVVVCGNSSDLARFMEDNFGARGSEMRLPKWLFSCSQSVRAAFASAYLCGDGHVVGGAASNTFGTTSLQLFGGMRLLVASLGSYMRFSHSPAKRYEYESYSRNNGEIFHGQSGGEGYRTIAQTGGLLPYEPPSRKLNRFIQDEEFYYIKISEVTKEQVSDLAVYNLDVEEDHSFVANGFVSHNCTELRWNRLGKPCDFRALDAGTIRLADVPLDDEDPKTVRYVQIYDEQVIAEFMPHELMWGVRNPRSGLQVNQYGNSEGEMAVDIITALLYGHAYNKLFFCATGDTRVDTRKGAPQLADLVGTEFEIWNGRRWSSARAVETGVRPLVRTKLWNGIELKTSPEHSFRIIPREGSEPTWRRQLELKNGDWALVSAEVQDVELDESLLLVGKTYESQRSWGATFVVTSAMVNDVHFWEMIGFSLGDGYWPNLSKKGDPQWLQIYPHHEKDAALFDRFLAVTAKHGINADLRTINKHHQRSDGAWGYPCVQIQHKAFVEWLMEIGFQSSTNGKRVPSVLFQMPLWIRRAILRGLFSADGCTITHLEGYRTPSVIAYNQRFRQDILQLLWASGIAANEIGTGWERAVTINIQNVRAFVEHVGYLQEYKNAGIERSDRSCNRWDKLHPAVSRDIASRIKAGPQWLGLDEGQKMTVREASKGRRMISRPKALHLLEAVGADVPDWLYYHQVEVDVLDTGPVGHELMFDVEVFDDEHIFLANGVAVHNSQGSVAKGLINFKGFVPPDRLQEFRRQWYAQISGLANAFRTPAFNVPEGMEYISMHSTNRDMEFSEWMNFNIKVLCSLCLCDPAELNFLYGNVGQTAALSQTPAEQRIKTSRDRGLRPILRCKAGWLNRHIIWPINDNYVLQFTGLDIKNAAEIIDNKKKVVTFLKTVDELRAEEDLEPLPDGKGEVILDPTWLQHASMIDQQAQMAQQAQQQEQQGQGQEGEPGGGGGEGEEGNGDAGDEGGQETQVPESGKREQQPPSAPAKKKSPWSEAMGKSRGQPRKAKIIRYEVDLD